MKKRLMSLLLCLSMVLSLLPAAAFPALAAGAPARSVMLGSTALAADGTGYLYYGRSSGTTPLLWRVLSNTPSDYKSYTDGTGTAYSAGDGYNLAIPLESISAMPATYSTFFNRNTDVIGETYTYANSELHTSLNTFQNAALTTAELGYLLPTTIVATHTGGASSNADTPLDSSTTPVVVPDQKVFEIGAVPELEKGNNSVSYWLRDTKHDYGRLLTAKAWTSSSGTGTYSQMDKYTLYSDHMRPSANLDAKIGLLTSLSGKPAVGAGLTATALYSDGKWVPTMTDGARTGFTASLSAATAGRNAEITITYSGAYTSAQSGDLMVLLLQDGAVRQTARIATASESGTVTLNTGSIVGGYEVKIFAESCPDNDVAVMSNVADAGTLTVSVSTDMAVIDSVNAINAKAALTVTQAAFDAGQQQAIADALNAWLLEHVNEGASVAASDIAISHVAPAQAGTSGVPAGVNGEVTFTPTVTKGVSSQPANSLTWTVTATPYTGLSDADAVSQAVAAVSALDFSTYQSAGNTEEELRALIAQKINEAISQSGVSVLTSQITVSTFTAATAGTSAAPAGTNGSFIFAVTLAKGSASQYVSGLTAKITATPYAAAGGQGTPDSPYILTTAADLPLLAAYPDAHFKLGANITITQAEGTFWTPLGNFSGTLDGDGYSISGLKLGVSATSLSTGGTSRVTNQGFFKSLTSTAIVKNLTFVSPQLPLNGARVILTGTPYSYADAGGFLADSSAGAIQNCRVENAFVDLMSDLTGSVACGGSDHFGGLVNINTGTVSNCTVDGITIIVPAYKTNNFNGYTTAPENYPQVQAIGGMIGENRGTVSGCTVTGLFMPSPEFWCKSPNKPYISNSTTLTIGFPNQGMSATTPMLGIGGLIGYQAGTCDGLSDLYVSCTMQTLSGSITGSPYYLAFNGFGYYEKNISLASNYLHAYTTNGAVIGYVQTSDPMDYVAVPATISAGVTDSATTAADAHHSYLAGGSVYGLSGGGVLSKYSHSNGLNDSAANTYTVLLKAADGALLRSYAVTKGGTVTLSQTRLSDGTIVTGWKDASNTAYAANAVITVNADITLTATGSSAGTLLWAVSTNTTASGVAQTQTAGSSVAYVPVFTVSSPAAADYALSYRLTGRDDLTWAATIPTSAGVYDVKISPKDPSLWTATVYTVTGGLTLTGPVPAGRITIASASATRTFSNQAQTVTAAQLDFDHTGIPQDKVTNIRYQSGTGTAITEAATADAPIQPGTYTVFADIAEVAPFAATPDYSLGTLTILTAAQSALTKNVFLKYSTTAQQTVSIASLLPAGIIGARYYAGYPTYSNKTAALFAVRPTCSASGVVSYQLASGLTEGNVGQTATIPVTVTSSNYAKFIVNVVVSIADHDDCSDKITFADGSLTFNNQGQKYENATISGITDGTWTYTYYSSTGNAYPAGSYPTFAGTYTVKATYTNSDYTGSKTAKLTIGKADNTLTNKTDGGYGDQVYGSVSDPTYTQFDATAPISSLTAIEWYQGSTKLSAKPVNVGDYKVKVTSNETGNYKAAACEVPFKITPKPITVTANAQLIPYNGSLSQDASKVTAAGLVNGDAVSAVTMSTADTNVTRAGTITPSAAVIKNGDADVTANYAITYATGTLIITMSKATILISADYTGKTYDGEAMAVPTAEQLAVTGMPMSEVTEGVFKWYDSNGPLSAVPVNAGSYKLRIELPPTENHSGFASEFYYVTIGKKAITPTVTLSQYSYTVNNNSCRPGVTVMDGSVQLSADQYQVAYANNVNVGTAAVTVTVNPDGNYSFTPVTKNFAINPDTTVFGSITATESVAYGGQLTVTVTTKTGSVFKNVMAVLSCGGSTLATISDLSGDKITLQCIAGTAMQIGDNLLTVTITGGTVGSDGVTLTAHTVLTPRLVSVSAPTAQTREYNKGNVSVALSGTPSLSGTSDSNVQVDATRVTGTMKTTLPARARPLPSPASL